MPFKDGKPSPLVGAIIEEPIIFIFPDLILTGNVKNNRTWNFGETPMTILADISRDNVVRSVHQEVLENIDYAVEADRWHSLSRGPCYGTNGPSGTFVHVRPFCAAKLSCIVGTSWLRCSILLQHGFLVRTQQGLPLCWCSFQPNDSNWMVVLRHPLSLNKDYDFHCFFCFFYVFALI